MITIVRGFCDYFFTRDKLIDFGKLINLLMFHNYAMYFYCL